MRGRRCKASGGVSAQWSQGAVLEEQYSPGTSKRFAVAQYISHADHVSPNGLIASMRMEAFVGCK